MNHNDHPAAPETLPRLFSRAVHEYGRKNCLISAVDGSVFTYADVAEVVRRIMARLHAEGVRKGDALCIYAPAQVEPYLVFWAAANLGAVVVPLDFQMPEKMLERILSQVRPKVLFSDCAGIARCPAIKERVRTILFDEPAHGACPDQHIFSQWLDSGGSEPGVPELRPDDAAIILYTSGSTGDPKGVVLSHGALCRSNSVVADLFHWTADDLVLSLAELHAIGGTRAVIAALLTGYSLLVTSRAQRSSVLYLAECIRTYRCTHLTTAPIVLRLFVRFRDRIRASDLSSLKSIMCAGSDLPQHLVDSFYEHFRVPVLNFYGLTETAGACIGTAPERFESARGSVGLPLGGTVAEIVGTGGAVLPDGSAGELRIRSSNLMSGYYKDAALTGTILRDGWLYTGDLATRRTDGQILLTGRIKNIIKQANGDYVCLEEVELALEKHPRVREAAVCGFSSSRGDERMAAFIVPDAQSAPTEELFKVLRQHIKDELGSAKIPAAFILKEALPRGSTGKLLREPLKRDFIESGRVPGKEQTHVISDEP